MGLSFISHEMKYLPSLREGGKSCQLGNLGNDSPTKHKGIVLGFWGGGVRGMTFLMLIRETKQKQSVDFFEFLFFVYNENFGGIILFSHCHC